MAKTDATVLVIHGPNLNMLGKREPELYGKESLDDINEGLKIRGKHVGVNLLFFQSNHEGEIVERLQAAVNEIEGLIINPAAFTHTSVAIRDALLLLDIPIIEIHLSNIYKRESFRHRSMIADVATAQISGLGSRGYFLALDAICSMIADTA
jgi:3-dehydroquinate dehydratase-2